MHPRYVKFRKSFLYPVVACAMLIYIYLEVSSSLASKPTFFIYNSDEQEAIALARNKYHRDNKRLLRLKHLIRDANKKQTILNEDIESGAVGLVIVVQVHDKLNYLKHLVDSLKKARGISKALIIFSHSFYDHNINSLIWNISFARVMQMYYPYSVQLYPNVFPGNDQKTCNEVMACRKSHRRALLNQHKHHWWWKVAKVFDIVSAVQVYNGTVLFLEENQYVTEDFIYIFKILEGLLNVSSPHCDILSLGSEEPKKPSYRAENTTILLKPWSISENIAIGFNRYTWNIIKKKSDEFCRFNDNRWDRSLRFLASKTLLGKFYVLTVESSRVLRFNKCKNQKICDELEKIEWVDTFVSTVKKGFYPHKMHIVKNESVEKIDAGNGGWADARDHELCRYFTAKRPVSH